MYNVLSINILEEQYLQSKFNNTCSLENISETPLSKTVIMYKSQSTTLVRLPHLTC